MISGIYDQVVWNLSHGRLFQTTLVYETAGTYDHFEPVLVLIAPIYWLFSDVRVLLVIQSLALALGCYSHLPLCASSFCPAWYRGLPGTSACRRVLSFIRPCMPPI